MLPRERADPARPPAPPSCTACAQPDSLSWVPPPWRIPPIFAPPALPGHDRLERCGLGRILDQEVDPVGPLRALVVSDHHGNPVREAHALVESRPERAMLLVEEKPAQRIASDHIAGRGDSNRVREIVAERL